MQHLHVVRIYWHYIFMPNDLDTGGPLRIFRKPDIKEELPLIILKNMVVFPRAMFRLIVKRPISLKALDFAMKHGRIVLAVAQKKETIEVPKESDFYRVGTVIKIRETIRIPKGGVKVIAEGITKAKITKISQTKPFFKAKIQPIVELRAKKTERIEILMQSVLNRFRETIALGAMVPLDVMLAIVNIRDPQPLIDLVVLNMDFKVAQKQSILEAQNIEEKLKIVNVALADQIKILRMAKRIEAETGKELGKMQKEVYLREQLKSIEKELGIAEGKGEMAQLEEKIKKSGMPEEVEKKTIKELRRLQRMPSFSPEVSWIRTYLDRLVELPWSRKSKIKINIKKAKKILDEDHYGLEKAKERVLEFLAVQKLVGKIKGSILCFIGPPGTGKTSIGKSIARATDRKFFRMSLGGIHDEAEIRGHRRTYVGALPGRIIQGIANAGTRNPVFMLDEIDKVGKDFRGDPTAALLEALDPEQNFQFSDHYLEVPFDLSDVMFITTGNILDTIPPALRDRMEVIEFPGYTEDEKFHIAKDYLLPKQIKAHGLKDGKNLKLTDKALRALIRGYTREAGVRNLDRSLAAICRKVAKKIIEGRVKSFAIKDTELKTFLGPARFHTTETEKKDEIGVATGMAWTQAGGEIILVEATKMPGKGKLILTGHMGKVMQESAQAAFSYIKSRAKSLDLDDKNFSKIDVHIHVPSGAIPKDGPSAGIAMAVALASCFTKRPAKRKVAMTGEITLRGRVMEIGGLKEKILAAHRGRIKIVILPKDNEKDLEELPKNVRQDIKFIFASHMDEVLKAALK